MRIATWNVNSLKARTEAVEKWVERAAARRPADAGDEAADADAPEMPFRMLGYAPSTTARAAGTGRDRERVGATDVVTNFGDGPVRDSTAGAAAAVGEDDFDPFDEARMVSAVCGGSGSSALRAERPGGRPPVLRGQAALVRAAPALARRDRAPRRSRSSSAAT